MSRLAASLLFVTFGLLAATGAFFGWRHLQGLEGEIAALRGSVADLGGELRRAEERAQRAQERHEEAEAHAQRSRELADRLAARAEEAEALAAKTGDEAATERERALAAAAEAEWARLAQELAEERSQAALRQAERARQDAELARYETEQMRQRRQRDLDRLQRVLHQIADTRQTALGLVMDLGDSIEFDFNRAELRPGNREILSRIAGVLLTAEGFGIQVYGHTDDVGSVEYNAELSERRARAVREYLVQAGVDPGVITAKGFGKSVPLVQGTDPESRQRNRRVEIAVVHVSGDLAPDFVAEEGVSR